MLTAWNNARDAHKRSMYRGGRPRRWARIQNQFYRAVSAAGIWPRRMAALEVRGRASGRVISLPVAIADYEGERYLVAMLGNNANWVRNVRASDGVAVLRHGRREDVRLVEELSDRRSAILRRYDQLARGARPHIPIDHRAPVEQFQSIAADFPIFRITPDARGGRWPEGGHSCGKV